MSSNEQALFRQAQGLAAATARGSRRLRRLPHRQGPDACRYGSAARHRAGARGRRRRAHERRRDPTPRSRPLAPNGAHASNKNRSDRVRLVLDTNVVISALLWRGTPYRLLEVIRRQDGLHLYSSALLEETQRHREPSGVHQAPRYDRQDCAGHLCRLPRSDRARRARRRTAHRTRSRR